MAMKGVNLGFATGFFEISAQGPSIYRDFGLMISCACMTPSPSFPIQGFGFDWIPLRFRLEKETPGSVCYLVREKPGKARLGRRGKFRPMAIFQG
jgi:hypothetical protein